MTFQILDIVVYSRAGEVHKIPLKPGKLNLIVGESGTGKSQIINVVEYCLGRSSCPIAVGEILDAAAWFGIRLQTNDGEIFLARESPEGATKNEMFIAKGDSVTIPPMGDLTANTNDKAVVQQLSRELGITPNLHVPAAGQTRPSLEANIKHTFFLTSQAQFEIANPNILFHRQSDEGVERAIRDTIPYFLGAVEENQLALVHELQEAKRALLVAQRELAEARAIRDAGRSRGEALVAEARAAGVLAAGESTNNADIRAILSPVLRWSPDQAPSLTPSGLAEYRSRQVSLRNQYAQLVARLKEVQDYASETEGFVNESNVQISRLRSIGVYPRSPVNENTCPICERELQSIEPASAEMKRALGTLQDRVESAKRESPRIEEYAQKLEANLSATRREIGIVEEGIEGLTREHENSRRLRDTNANAAQVVGRISYFLETFREENELAELDANAEAAQQEVERLQDLLSNATTQERLDEIVAEVSDRITELAREMGLEHSSKPVRLDLRRLTVVIENREGRLTPLSRVGSGENHEGYHVATFLALHEWFARHRRPVPGFLFLDQPSQVYYGGVERDREKIDRLIELFNRTCAALEGELQIIVLDHLPNAPPYSEHVVADWWDGMALIPPSWLQQE